MLTSKVIKSYLIKLLILFSQILIGLIIHCQHKNTQLFEYVGIFTYFSFVFWPNRLSRCLWMNNKLLLLLQKEVVLCVLFQNFCSSQNFWDQDKLEVSCTDYQIKRKTRSFSFQTLNKESPAIQSILSQHSRQFKAQVNFSGPWIFFTKFW